MSARGIISSHQVAVWRTEVIRRNQQHKVRQRLRWLRFITLMALVFTLQVGIAHYLLLITGATLLWVSIAPCIALGLCLLLEVGIGLSMLVFGACAVGLMGAMDSYTVFPPVAIMMMILVSGLAAWGYEAGQEV
jgi:hypothetical protein